MKILSYNKHTMEYGDLTYKAITIFVSSILLISAITCYIFINNPNNIKYISEESKQIFINENNKFSEKELKKLILELNLKFPHIVLAQAKLETGSFKSQIFIENNNLFGMKVARSRPTTNKGEQYEHAVFSNWRESVIDYGFWQARFLSNIKNENDYLEYLKQSYAEDPNYIIILKQIINETI